jgi:diguanylate cyclase (GGDEF)-like protein
MFVTLLIYFTKGVTLYWHLYAIPLIIAAFTYDVIGGVLVGLLGAGMIAGWMIFLNPYLNSVMNENMTYRVVEITLGLFLYIGMGAALGYLARSHKQQKTLLEGLSVHDRLTGLYNYSYFVDRLTEEKTRADRYGNFFSLIMFDIDFFKMFNDTYGHEAGNEVIQRIGKVVSKSVRNVDIVSRYGGEEFAILLPYTLGQEAQKVAERIREAIAKEKFSFAQSGSKSKKTPQNVTISGGIATYPTDAKNETEVIINADRALYKAKASGRNRVCVFSKTDIEHDQNLIKH